MKINTLLHKIVLQAFVMAGVVSFLFASRALAGIVDSGKLTEAEYWILNNNAGDQVVLEEDGIEDFNKKICEAKLDVTDMKALPDGIPVREILPWITNTWAMGGTVYRNGKELTEAEKAEIRENLDLEALPGERESAAVRYGVTVRHTMVRNLPLADCCMNRRIKNIIMYACTTCLAGSPGTILLFVRLKNGCAMRIRRIFSS